jgi:hypothetical protein
VYGSRQHEGRARGLRLLEFIFAGFLASIIFTSELQNVSKLGHGAQCAQTKGWTGKEKQSFIFNFKHFRHIKCQGRQTVNTRYNKIIGRIWRQDTTAKQTHTCTGLRIA